MLYEPLALLWMQLRSRRTDSSLQPGRLRRSVLQRPPEQGMSHRTLLGVVDQRHFGALSVSGSHPTFRQLRFARLAQGCGLNAEFCYL